jgi:kumamolisin
MKSFNNSINQVPTIGQTFDFGLVKEVQPEHLNKEICISFHFDLTQDKQNLLDQKINAGEILTLEQLHNDFSPNQSEVDTLINWLKSNGYTNVYQSNDKCNVYATSTADNISKTLNCDMTLVDDGTNMHIGASSAPSLPAEISNSIHSINGLQPFRVRQKRLQKHDTIRYHKSTSSQNNKQVSYGLPYLVNTILTAYNGTGLTYSGLNQTIGILIDTFPSNTDLTKFWTANSVNTNLNRINKINVRNTSMPAPSGEESLDTQWTSGIAPNAKINIYASGNLYFTSLDIAIDKMILDAGSDPTFRQISISLGLGEKFMSSGEMTTENTKYARLRALGVNIFVSSGDNGSSPSNQLQVEFAASNPNVIAVGGTSLRVSGTGSVTSESAWSGSGGGVSIVYPKQTWQPGTSNGRLVPDVSAPADPNYGAYVVLGGYVYQIGGTSWSAPVWAGICALVNEARVSVGKSRIGFLPPILYPYIGQNKFRDITSGSNGAYSAAVGYDKVTGIGTPNIKNLISALIAI